MDRYQKVEKPRPEEPIHENEIRITSQGLVRNYISYATALLQEKRGREIVLKAMGQAISKTVAITEILKRRTPSLHQDTAISSVSITDVWEPIEEGLLPVEQTRKVSMISITLSTKELNKNSPGYQAASNVEQTKPQHNYQQQRQPLRQPRATYNAVNEDSYGRGRGRGRGRGGRGWSRGGYGNYQENDGYSNWGRGGYGNYQENAGYSNSSRGGYGNYQENAGYSNSSRGGYGNYQENAGYSNSGRGGGRGRGWGNRGGGYERSGGYEGGRGGGYERSGGYEGGRGGGYERSGGYEGGRGGGYEGGRGGGGGRGYGSRGRGRMGSRPRGGGNNQE